MPPLGLVGQAEAAPEALYIGHAKRKREYEWEVKRLSDSGGRQLDRLDD